LSDDIQPNVFKIKKGTPASLEIAVKENGEGCMSSIMVPGLYNESEYLQAGKTIVMKFTPEQTGDYEITCAMGVPRGIIKVIS
jgi:plastocyanin domain-containing protein